MKPKIKLHVLPAVFVAIALSPLVALAQTSPVASPGMTTTTTMADDRGEREEHHDLGWIGLVGLLGLAGLLGKKHDDRRQDSTADRTDRPPL